MSETTNIIKNSRLSIDRVDVERTLTVDINNTVGKLKGGGIKSTIDLNEQYIKERNACNDYRLILTIKPYCTNVLFNACTEAVLKEGSDETDVVMLNDNIDTKKIKSKIKGKDSGVTIYDMIRNTEYSKDEIGFEYHPGLDIFNNHIIRNKTYRIVNDYIGNDRKVFNTIEDFMRDASGNRLKRCCRVDADEVNNPVMKDRHLYDKEDILPFYTGEAINENLREQDGWFGFYNTSVISAKNRAGNDMDISRVINNKGNCEFIDMYPDRTLFSFVPKYNKYRNRLEYNWDYAVTYPFESTTQYTYETTDDQGTDICVTEDIELIQNDKVNALATITVEYRRLPNGNGAVFFRSAAKHNLKANDSVNVYFNLNESSGNGNWRKSCHTYTVTGVGDINGMYKDYYFYITNLDLLEEIFCTPYLCDIFATQIDYTYSAWDYVRDYFYDVYEPDQIPEFDDGKTYKVGQLVRVPSGSSTTENDDLVYITTKKHTGAWVDTDFELFDDNRFVEYPGSGLTNIPTENDAYIKANGYVSYSPDLDSPDHYIQEGADYYIGNIIKYNEGEEIGSLGKYYEIINGLIVRGTSITSFPHIVTAEDEFYKYKANNYVQFTNNTGSDIEITEWGVYFYEGITKYILCNHDRDIIYDGSVDCGAFIRAIINNAFTNNDIYTTNEEVNPSMNGVYSDYISMRFVKSNGNYDCSYYVRKFKKIPGADGLTLDKETYQLAFSNTIYGDSIVQSVFTDNINVTGLKDNLGRDLSEVFLTVVKTNRGHEKWYGTTNGPVSDANNDNVIHNDPDIEYSHCFGNVTCGFELSQELDDTSNIRDIRRDFIDVTLININNNIKTIPNCMIEDGFTTNDIKITDDWFYGDVVEFCPWTCEETVISDVCFRFNTAQRELDDNEAGFKFDEILTDDFDENGFKICTYKVSNIVARDEGYYYKAHYRIPLRDLSPVIQGSHPYISVFNARPVQIDGIYILVTTSLKHNLFPDSQVLLRDTVDDADGTPEWWLDVVYIVDDHSFVMKTVDRQDANYRDWITICTCLNNNSYTLRAKNPDIPDTASRLGVNTFLWKNTVGITDVFDTDSEVNKYVFANNAIYVDTCFNFYLKRQDPYNVNGLYFDGSKCQITCLNGSEDKCTNMNAIDRGFLADVESKADTSESIFEYNDTEYNAQC